MGRLVKMSKTSIAAASLLATAVIGISTSPSANAAALAPYDAKHAGGTVKLLAAAAGGTLDPKVNYTAQYWQLYQATYDGLLTFKIGRAHV